MVRNVFFLLMSVCCWLELGHRESGNKKPPSPVRKRRLDPGDCFCSEDFSLRTSDEFPHPATLGFVSAQVGTLRFSKGIPDV
jgi:hypothetical protein